MRTIGTIFLILAAGSIIGLAVNCKSFIPGDLDHKKNPGACKQETIKGDPFEVFGLPKNKIDS